MQLQSVIADDERRYNHLLSPAIVCDQLRQVRSYGNQCLCDTTIESHPVTFHIPDQIQIPLIKSYGKRIDHFTLRSFAQIEQNIIRT